MNEYDGLREGDQMSESQKSVVSQTRSNMIQSTIKIQKLERALEDATVMNQTLS